VAAESQSPGRRVELAEFREHLEKAIGKLPPRIAQVFQLYTIEERPNQEVCERLNSFDGCPSEIFNMVTAYVVRVVEDEVGGAPCHQPLSSARNCLRARCSITHRLLSEMVGLRACGARLLNQSPFVAEQLKST
jgi:hypothetical protein